jgi:HPt (histidine-containing phosphotransfer) domain-containing protein
VPDAPGVYPVLVLVGELERGPTSTAGKKNMSQSRANVPHRSSNQRREREALRDREGSTTAVIDVAHLARMTFGEKALQAEILALFDRQAEMLVARMRQASPQAAAAFAHTLGGSARGVGAWRVAAAAEQVELAGDAGAITGAVQRLEAAIGEARAVIGELLRVA